MRFPACFAGCSRHSSLQSAGCSLQWRKESGESRFGTRPLLSVGVTFRAICVCLCHLWLALFVSALLHSGFCSLDSALFVPGLSAVAL